MLSGDEVYDDEVTSGPIESTKAAHLTIRVRVNGMDEDELTQALSRSSTHDPMNEVEQALWVELNPYDPGEHKRRFQADVDVWEWDVR